MIFLADIETDGPRYKKDEKSKRVKDNKKKPVKQKKSVVTKLANKTAGATSFTQGEIAVVKSMIANDVKTPLNNKKSNQKTIGTKKNTKYHRSI